jgi:hypothetical protein
MTGKPARDGVRIHFTNKLVETSLGRMAFSVGTYGGTLSVVRYGEDAWSVDQRYAVSWADLQGVLSEMGMPTAEADSLAEGLRAEWTARGGRVVEREQPGRLALAWWSFFAFVLMHRAVLITVFALALVGVVSLVRLLV